MRQTFVIEGRLAGMNEYVFANRSNRFKGAALKKENQEKAEAAIAASGIVPFDKPVIIHYLFVEPNCRRDVDNIASGGTKVISDALVAKGIIPDDNQKWVKGMTCKFLVNAKNPRIEVTVAEEDEWN